MKRQEALRFRRSIEQAAELQADKEALDNILLYPEWKVGIEAKAGKRYRWLDKLYRCNQSHTTQADWEPDKVPALFTEVSIEEWPEWVQPTGAQDAYAKDAQVSHNNKHWISDVDGNVWEPGVYGWTEQVSG